MRGESLDKVAKVPGLAAGPIAMPKPPSCPILQRAVEREAPHEIQILSASAHSQSEFGTGRINNLVICINYCFLRPSSPRISSANFTSSGPIFIDLSAIWMTLFVLTPAPPPCIR